MQNIFKQILTISSTLIFYGYNLQKKLWKKAKSLTPSDTGMHQG
jgi:hypothetical protein